MNKVVLDQELRARLNNLDKQFELCDELGRTLGHFLPEDVYHRLVYEWAKNLFTDEELEQARRDPGRFTTEEVLEHLKSL